MKSETTIFSAFELLVILYIISVLMHKQMTNIPIIVDENDFVFKAQSVIRYVTNVVSCQKSKVNCVFNSPIT